MVGKKDDSSQLKPECLSLVEGIIFIFIFLALTTNQRKGISFSYLIFLPTQIISYASVSEAGDGINNNEIL